MNRDVCEHFNPVDLPCGKCKPEALRLADALEISSNHGIRREAAAELRRLHAENESLRQIVHDFPPVEAELREVSDRAHRLEAQRDALLEALKEAFRAFAFDDEGPVWADSTIAKARAAIKAAEENA